MIEKAGTTQDPATKPGDSSDQLDNPPFWSPWNFQTNQRDWHEIIYDEMRSGYMKREYTQNHS
jgi:hypothetical protein